MNTLFIQVLPSYHICRTEYEERNIEVNPKILLSDSYSVSYCPKCEVYTYHHGEGGKKGIESKNPKDVATYIEGLQLETDRENRKKGLIQ